MSRVRQAALAGLAFALFALARPLAAQESSAVQEPVAATETPAPPPGGIVERERAFVLGFGFGSLSWDDQAPYDDLTVTSLVLERNLLRILRARGAIAYGGTTFEADGPVDTRLLSLDVQLVALPDVGPLRAVGVMPYLLSGVGSLIMNPSGDGGRDLPTRSQSQAMWGVGVLARLGSRFEARGERIHGRVRLADPVDAANQDTTTITTHRWEGRISWVF